MTDLTEKQKKVLEFIVDFIKNNGVPPSFREIAEFFSYKSLRTVYDHIKTLERKGFLKKESGKSRHFFPVRDIEISERLNVYEDIAAGYPKFSDETIVDNVVIDADWMDKKSGKIALRIKGDSMIDAHIKDGDYAIIEKDVPIYSGDIVAIIIEKKVALNYYELTPDFIVLHSANASMKDIKIARGSAKIEIIGKAVAIVRRL